ncbi:MAG TPA: hypothetical protein VG713_09600 [Pirellulales bacterium]|nr:hypothetical protein [Pirellulales bacterium]
MRAAAFQRRHFAVLLAIVFALATLIVFILAGSLEGAAGIERYTAAKIAALRAQAEQAKTIPENAPEGWSKSSADPGKLVGVFQPLRLREGFVLRAYQFREDGNGNAFVWALPATAAFPEPQDCPKVANQPFSAPRPPQALDNFMEAIDGDRSAWSYMAASLLRRELREFGAMWHGYNWMTHVVLDDNPLGIPVVGNDDIMQRPSGKPDQWKWLDAEPKAWAPEVSVENDRVLVTFYTYSGLYKQTIYRHVDTYEPGKYLATSEDKAIAEGPPGFAF